MIRIFLKECKLFVGLFLNGFRQRAVNTPRTLRKRENGSSLIGSLLAAHAKPLFESGELARRDIGVDLFIPGHGTATGRKILLHLAIPFIFLQFVKPSSPLTAFWLREMDDASLMRSTVISST